MKTRKKCGELLHDGLLEFKRVLLHSFGDHRQCPHCKKVFILDDRTSNEALELFTDIYGRRKRAKNKKMVQ